MDIDVGAGGIELLKSLQKSEEWFDVRLVTWKIDPVYFELKENSNPIYSRPYPVLKVHVEISKNEVERSVLLEVLEIEIDPERGAPYFSQPKTKSNLVRFISDFRNLNKQ